MFLFESTSVVQSVDVWNDQQEWVIHSWKLFPSSGVHVLETFSGKILYMFADTPYPLSASLMKKMLKHKLEVEVDGVGNDMTYAVQLIKFIKNQACPSVFLLIDSGILSRLEIGIDIAVMRFAVQTIGSLTDLCFMVQLAEMVLQSTMNNPFWVPRIVY
ncbi:hypothetical protein Tco_1304021 [Tanacetum coccineum]